MLRPILLASARNDINRIHTLFNNNALFKCLHYVDDFFVEVELYQKPIQSLRMFHGSYGLVCAGCVEILRRFNARDLKLNLVAAAAVSCVYFFSAHQSDFFCDAIGIRLRATVIDLCLCSIFLC